MATKKSRNSKNEKALTRILGKFDSEDKKLLALELVTEFNLQKDGEPYIKQLKSMLKRDLTNDEVFKVDILDRMLRFHGGGGGGGGHGVKGIAPAPPPPPRV